VTIDLCGVAVSLSGHEPTVENLLRDFSSFGAGLGEAEIGLSLTLERPFGPPPPLVSFPAKRAVAWDRGPVRHVLYDDGSRAYFDFATGRGSISAETPGRLHEVSYLAVLGLCGERLDALGLHRVHALGFVHEGRGGVLILESGGGKSELALRLAEEGAFGLLADDTPILTGGGMLRSFPTRLSFRPGADLARVPLARRRPFHRRGYGPRTLVDVGLFDRVLAERAPLAWILAGEKAGSGPGWIREAGRARAMAALLDGMVVGRGVAQMAEWRIRTAALPALVRASASRLRAAWSAASLARVGVMKMDRDPSRNLRNLRDWIGEPR
jgi:hypothetical protein